MCLLVSGIFHLAFFQGSHMLNMNQYLIYFYGSIILHYVIIPLFKIHLSIDVYLGCFHLLSIMNNDAVNIHVQLICVNFF